MTAQYIQISRNGLKIRIKSTKTLRGDRPRIIEVNPARDANLCPVRAWIDYYNSVFPCPLGPAFMIN